MPSYALLVTSDAADGRDDEYNSWYDGTHLRDLLAIPGVVSGRRLEALPSSPATPPGRYLAMYEIECDDPTSVLAEIGRRAQAGEMMISDALDRDTARMFLYRVR